MLDEDNAGDAAAAALVLAGEAIAGELVPRVRDDIAAAPPVARQLAQVVLTLARDAP